MGILMRPDLYWSCQDLIRNPRLRSPLFPAIPRD